MHSSSSLNDTSYCSITQSDNFSKMSSPAYPAPSIPTKLTVPNWAIVEKIFTDCAITFSATDKFGEPLNGLQLQALLSLYYKSEEARNLTADLSLHVSSHSMIDQRSRPLGSSIIKVSSAGSSVFPQSQSSLSPDHVLRVDLFEPQEQSISLAQAAASNNSKWSRVRRAFTRKKSTDQLRPSPQLRNELSDLATYRDHKQD